MDRTLTEDLERIARATAVPDPELVQRQLRVLARAILDIAKTADAVSLTSAHVKSTVSMLANSLLNAR